VSSSRTGAHSGSKPGSEGVKLLSGETLARTIETVAQSCFYPGASQSAWTIVRSLVVGYVEEEEEEEPGQEPEPESENEGGAEGQSGQ